ncbi:asparagine synthetase B family protein [Rubrivivax sp. RP6-9]|uniref:asparagine synthetase B family protein n=1 Tax=Rubrivivax sp. RP6-9 TaxID=3415750 RepID=UPI003CC56CB6
MLNHDARATLAPTAARVPTLTAGRPRFPAEAGAATDSAEHRWRRLLQLHGPAQAARHVDGDFSVALTLDDGSVFLAVDRFAARSLCYRVEGTALRVAPRADGLGGGTAQLDPQALFDYLYFHVIPSPRTVHQGVHRLPPGHYALFRDGRLTVAPYWTPTFAPQRRPSFDDLREEFRGLLHQAVRRQLDGSRPACFLSGGTDSSTVAGLIGEVAGQPAATYSIGFEAEGYDEMAYARIAAQRYRTEHHEYYVTPADLVASIGKVAASYDQPFGNSSAVPAYHCALNAAGDGVTRLLAGDGGDELFGGNTRYATQRLFGFYQQVPQVVRRGLLEPFFSIGAVGRMPLLKRGTGYIRQANTPLPGRMQAFNLLRRLGFGEVLTPAFLAQVDPANVMTQQQAVWDATGHVDEIDQHLAFDWRYTLAENDLPKVVGTAALAGVDVGFPLLDDDLLAFSMRLPPAYKLKGFTLRWFFKEALRGFLPDEIITKKKQGFGLPFGVWLLRDEPLRRLASESLQAVTQRGVVQPQFVQRLLHEHLPSAPHYYGGIVWVLMMLEQWLQVHAPTFRVET